MIPSVSSLELTASASRIGRLQPFGDLKNMGNLRLTTSEILGRSRGALANAEMGFNDMVESIHAERQLAGLKTLATSGRQVMFILNKLKSTEPNYDAWWNPIVELIGEDPLFRFFKRLRNVIEKEGLPEVRAVLLAVRGTEVVREERVKAEDGENFSRIEGIDNNLNPTPGIVVNWAVVSGGTHQRLSQFRLPSPPTSHLGQPLEDDTMEHLGALYLDGLSAILQSARNKFGGSENKSP